MLSKNNYNEKIRKSNNKRNKYSIRKLSVGAVSALIGVSFFGFSSQVVSADTGINTAGDISHHVACADTADNNSNGHNNPATDSDTWQIGSQNTKEYDGKETNKIDVNKFSLSDGDKKLNTSSINNDNFQWVDKNGDAIVENPKNVGTYYAKLTDSAAKKLRKDKPTLSKDPGIVGTYTIAQGKASAELRGYDSKAADAGFNVVAKRYEDLGYVVETTKTG